MSSYNGAATGYANPTTSTGNASAYQPANNYQTSPSGYTPGNTGYQPGVNSSAPGNTGYNPTDVYSNPSSAAGSGAATMPARADNEYRPGRHEQLRAHQRKRGSSQPVALDRKKIARRLPA